MLGSSRISLLTSRLCFSDQGESSRSWKHSTWSSRCHTRPQPKHSTWSPRCHTRPQPKHSTWSPRCHTRPQRKHITNSNARAWRQGSVFRACKPAIAAAVGKSQPKRNCSKTVQQCEIYTWIVLWESTIYFSPQRHLEQFFLEVCVQLTLTFCRFKQWNIFNKAVYADSASSLLRLSIQNLCIFNSALMRWWCLIDKQYQTVQIYLYIVNQINCGI